MDVATAEIRYQRWVQAIQGWSNSGLSKRDYCQQNNIDEKQFYYYQRRIRAIIAEQGKRPVLPKGGSELPTRIAEQQNNRPQIVKLRVSDTVQGSSSTISFGVNGMELSVPEDVPVSFLTKLLEAASHDSH